MIFDPSVLRLLWYVCGTIGQLILVRRPDILLFEETFRGTTLKIATAVLIPFSCVAGPVTLAAALLMPKKQMCPRCRKVIRLDRRICTSCNNVIQNSGTDAPEHLPHRAVGSHLTPQVQAAILQGKRTVNLPIILIMLIVWIAGIILSLSVLKDPMVMALTIPAGTLSGWLWWSYQIPRWREWALQQPGVTPNELQAAAEAALLVWPKGHFFERTEFRTEK